MTESNGTLVDRVTTLFLREDVDKDPYDGLAQRGCTVLAAPDLRRSVAPSYTFKSHDRVQMYARSA